MTKHKFTDEEVIKALECCSQSGMINCRACPYEASCNMGESKMQAHALDLINRQKAEIERLNILVNEAKTKRAKKFVPQQYIQLTIDEMESEA